MLFRWRSQDLRPMWRRCSGRNNALTLAKKPNLRSFKDMFLSQDTVTLTFLAITGLLSKHAVILLQLVNIMTARPPTIVPTRL